MEATINPESNARFNLLRTPGFWLAALIGLAQALNAVRATIDPAGFAGYMGLPLATAADVGFVQVYALRTAFIAVLVFVMLGIGAIRPLAWMALCALFLPIGDALLASQAGAAEGTVLRHWAIAVYLLIAAVVLFRGSRRHGL